MTKLEPILRVNRDRLSINQLELLEPVGSTRDLTGRRYRPIANSQRVQFGPEDAPIDYFGHPSSSPITSLIVPPCMKRAELLEGGEVAPFLSSPSLLRRAFARRLLEGR